jgi:Protein of unknown function (DUF3500)
MNRWTKNLKREAPGSAVRDADDAATAELAPAKGPPRAAIARRPRYAALAGAITAVFVVMGVWLATSVYSGQQSTSGGDPTSAASRGTSQVAAVVDAANEFLATLSPDDRAKVLLDYTQTNATAWSYWPCGAECRVGIELNKLTDAQVEAAHAVLVAALGTDAGTGYDRAAQIMLADEQIDPSSNGRAYYIALLGTPSLKGTWQLHFDGHHLAINLTYADGVVTGVSPFAIGVDPSTWTGDDGTVYAPLESIRAALVAVISTLDSGQLARAKLAGPFTANILAMSADGAYPQSAEGITGRELTNDQRTHLLAAIAQWVALADEATQVRLQRLYSAELNDTYVSYAGSPELTSAGDYVRIDGPGVWIEFICQSAEGELHHFDSVYRDKTRDYGGQFDF